MINNFRGRNCVLAALILGLLGSCAKAAPPTPPGFQGVVEFEERVFGFELPGRVTRVEVVEGDRVGPDALIAELDSAIQRSSRAAHEAEVAAAKSNIAVARAGARGEEIRSMEARVRAAKAHEDLITKNLSRDRVLAQTGVIAQSVVDNQEGELARAIAERQSIEQSVALLKRGGRREDIQAAESRAEAAASALAMDDLRIARHELKAVGTGTVLDVHVEPGEVVAAGSPVVTVADTLHPYVDVFVPQARAAGVKLKAPAKIRVDALQAALTGHVEFISPRTEFTPRFLFSEQDRPNLVVRVRVRIDDGKEQLLSGLPAFVTFATLPEEANIAKR
jgi:HlyD family secretion protein